MSHESTIKIYRSNSFGSIPTGLTDGELATNLADGKFFVGNGNQVLKFDANPNNNIGASGSGMETVAAYNDSIHFSIPKRTNLILYSHDFVSAFFPNSWSVYNASGNQPYPTVTNLDNDTTKGWQGGATGGFQIDFLNPSDANNGVYQEIRTPHLVTGEYYTLSCWARSDAGETKFRFSDFNYTTNVSRFSDKFIATTNPQRFYYVFIPESRTNVAIGNAGLGSHGTILVWGIQLERGVFPSSPIRSDGNETTTSASILSFSSGTSGTSTSSGVSSLNGLTGNIGLTGITDGAVRVVNNDKLDVRIAGNSLTGVAAFNSTYYTVSAAGLVSPSAPFATSVTGFNGLTGNIGLTGIAGGAVRVVNNDKLDVRIASTSLTGVAAFSSTHYTVSAAGLVSPSAPFATTGDTVRAEWPIKQSISGKRVTLSMDLATLWDPFNAKPDTNGYYWPGTDPGSFSSIERPGATVGLSGACPAFWHEHFSLSKKSPAVFNPNTGFDEIIDRVDDYCIFLRSDTIPGGLLQTSPFGASGSGIGVTGTTSGILKYFYLDINNLETASNTISTNDEILVYDSSETGEIKTKKTSISKFILDSDTLFSSLSPDQLKRNSKTSSIEFEIVLGDIDNESLGLITGVSAHSYINKNTVRSTNGCTGQITITGTQNEVNVSTSCPTIVIGLPDNVMIPYISVSGATFTETVSASLFIGSIAGGTF